MGSPAPLDLLRPRSIAVLGASDRSRWSEAVFANLAAAGFAGAVHAINPRGGTAHGRPAAASCAALGEAVDLGVLIVPAQAAADALRDLAASGARHAAILSSGFAETGEAGAAAQRDLAALARDLGIRLLGPNSLGFINFVNGAHVWTTPVRSPSRREGVAIVSQSGATAYFLSTLAAQWDVGLSHVVATGNEADLDLAAFGQALLEDPAVRSLALFVETVRDPAGFVALAEAALHERKPVIVLKVGASEVTAKAALAHTGALVGDDRVFDGACRQYGVIRAHAIEELLAAAEIAGRTGVLRKGGLGIVSNSGGICEIAADTAAARGIELPALTPDAAAALRETIPGFATPHNPLDLTGAITPEQCGRVVEIVGSQPDIAALLCPYYEVPTSSDDVNDRLSALHAALARSLNAAGVPGFVVSYTATHQSPLSRDIVAGIGLPYLACGLDRAIAGVAGAMAWSARLREGATLPAAAALPIAERPRSEHAALRCLASAGVPVVPMTLAANEDEAAQAARRIGGRLVVKIASPDIAHKTDIGGVALNVEGEAAVREAYRAVMAAASRHAPSAGIEGVIVAPMRPRGIELLVGISRDPQWGLVMALGLGGVWVEALKDVALRLLPLDAAEVKRALAGLRGATLLRGGRGVPAADTDAVAEAVMSIGQAALAFGPGLATLEVNPLWVHGDRVEALDALCVWNEGN
ncbi:acetate--CoA ligase family protein [Falsiroseomonas sp. HW251]|uniref:acetate--CoA ligase family protein n=1 Tax=Falsiroseomonas sp. HW251 TaxID=3390998 RepID=UPI003D31782B